MKNFKGKVLKPNPDVVKFYDNLENSERPIVSTRPSECCQTEGNDIPQQNIEQNQNVNRDNDFHLFNPILVIVPTFDRKEFMTEAMGPLLDITISVNAGQFQDLLQFLDRSVFFPHFFQKVWSAVYNAVTKEKSMRLYTEGKSTSLGKGACNANASALHTVMSDQSMLTEWYGLVNVFCEEKLILRATQRSFISKLIFHINRIIIKDNLKEHTQSTENKLMNAISLPFDATSERGSSVIRHLGGWVIHTIISYANKCISDNLSSESKEVQTKMSFQTAVRKLCLSVTESSLEIHDKTKYQSSLHHSDHYNRGGLTYISDQLFEFFLSLERTLERVLNSQFLILMGSKWMQFCSDTLYNDKQLLSDFHKSFALDSCSTEICQVAIEDDFDDIDILACHFAENSIDDDIILSFANDNSNDFLEEQFESYPIDTDIPVYFESSSDSDLSDNCMEGASKPENIQPVPLEESEINPQIIFDSRNKTPLQYIFQTICTKYVRSRGKQILNRIKQDVSISKKQAHRKNVAMKKAKADISIKGLIETFREDKTNNCVSTHNILKGKIQADENLLHQLTKNDLCTLCQAYGLGKPKSKDTKSILVPRLTDKITSCDHVVEKKHFLDNNSGKDT